MHIPRPRRLVAASVTTLMTTALVTGSLLTANPATANPATAPTTASTAAAGPLDSPAPRTGFELTNGARWTTQAEEQQFLEQLDTGSDRVRVRQIATTRQGRPLRLVTLSEHPNRSDHAVAAGSSVLFVCSQHGNEPSGREACLQTIRDLAGARDSATARLLSRTTLMFVPNANPDGAAADTRGNSDGVDINRDHLATRTVEGQAIAGLVRDLRPDVVHDLHEYGTIPGLYDWHMLYLWPRNLNVSDPVRDISRSLGQDFVAPALASAGFTSSTYGIRRDGVQIAGGPDERIMRNMMGLRHSIGLLSESAVDPLNPAEEADLSLLQRRRVETQLIAAQATLRLVSEQWRPIAAATRASAIRAIVDGARGTGPFFLGGADNEQPTPDQVIDQPACSYLLTGEQAEAVAPVLTAHGIATKPGAAGSRVVSMAQPARRVIPLLLDVRATFEIAAATPQPCGPGH